MGEKYIIENAQQLLGILYDLETPSALDILQAYKDLEGTLQAGEVAELHRLEENGFVLAVGDEVIFSNTKLEVPTESEGKDEYDCESRLDSLEEKMDKLFDVISELSNVIDNIVNPSQSPELEPDTHEFGLEDALSNVEKVVGNKDSSKEDVLEALYNLAYFVNKDKNIPLVLLELDNAEIRPNDKELLSDAVNLLTENLPQVFPYSEMILKQLEKDLDNLTMIPEVSVAKIFIECEGNYIGVEGEILFYKDDLLDLVNSLREYA